MNDLDKRLAKRRLFSQLRASLAREAYEQTRTRELREARERFRP